MQKCKKRKTKRSEILIWFELVMFGFKMSRNLLVQSRLRQLWMMVAQCEARHFRVLRCTGPNRSRRALAWVAPWWWEAVRADCNTQGVFRATWAASVSEVASCNAYQRRSTSVRGVPSRCHSAALPVCFHRTHPTTQWWRWELYFPKHTIKTRFIYDTFFS